MADIVWRSKRVFENAFIWLAIGGLTLLLAPTIRYFNLADIPNLPLLLLLSSFPHFFQTYFLFYRRPQIWREHQFIAIVLPVLLLIAVVALQATYTGKTWSMHLLLALFYWHIARQTFGVSWHYVDKENRTPQLRQAILLCTLIFGLTGWLSVYSAGSQINIYRFVLTSFQLNPFYFHLAHSLAWMALGFAAYSLFRAQRSGTTLNSQKFLFSITVLFAFALWMYPASSIASLALLPILHGLQYFGFSLSTLNMGHRVAIISFFACVVLGWLLFQLLPSYVPQNPDGTTWVVTGIYLFMNIHHYFIDGIIWKGAKREEISFSRTPTTTSA